MGQMLESAHEKELRQMRPPIRAAAMAAREFTAVGDDRYRLSIPGIGVAFEIDRLRREHHELVGELSVRCELPGARTVNGNLSIADFNLSSARARTVARSSWPSAPMSGRSTGRACLRNSASASYRRTGPDSRPSTFARSNGRTRKRT